MIIGRQGFIKAGAAAAPGWWVVGTHSAAGAWRFIGAGSAAESLQDLSGNSLHLSDANKSAATWSSGAGWDFTTASDTGYLSFNYALPTGNSFGGTTMVRYASHTNADANASVLSWRVTNNVGYRLIPQDVSAVVRFVNYAHGAGSVGYSSGTIGMTGQNGYINGSFSVAATDNSRTPGTVTISIGNAIGQNTLRCTIQAAVLYPTALSAAEMSTLHTNMTALT